MRQAVMPDCRWLAGYCGLDIFLPAMQLAAMTASRNFFGLEYAKIGNKSAPIQLALHRFRELAIFNINIFFKYIRKTGRERLDVDDIALMILQQNRLRWYGHVLRKDDNDWVKNAWSMKLRVQDQRGPGKRLFKRTGKNVS